MMCVAILCLDGDTRCGYLHILCVCVCMCECMHAHVPSHQRAQICFLLMLAYKLVSKCVLIVIHYESIYSEVYYVCILVVLSCDPCVCSIRTICVGR